MYESFSDFVDEGPLENIRVEVEVSSNIFRFNEFEFLTSVVDDPPPLSEQPTVEQTWGLSYGPEGSNIVKVETIGIVTNEYSLPSFVAPAEADWNDYFEGAIAFYSARFDRFYFLYDQRDGNIGIVSCLNSNNGACDYQEMRSSDFYIDDLEKGGMSTKAKVYDDLQLVALPVICCMCRTYDYFVFNETSIVRSIPMLDDYVGKSTNVDPRTQTAYAVKEGGGIYGNNFGVRSESYDPDVPAGEWTYSTYELSYEKVQSIFETPVVPTTPKTFPTTLSATSLVYGNMFDVIGNTYIIVTGMSVHIADTETHHVEVYLRKNSATFMNVQRHPGAWRLIGDISVEGNGAGVATPLTPGSFDPVTILQGTNQGFYVTLTDGKFMGQTDSEIGSTGQVYLGESNNGDLSVTVGVGKDYLFGRKYDAAIFNGEIQYFVDEVKLASSLEASSATPMLMLGPTHFQNHSMLAFLAIMSSLLM